MTKLELWTQEQILSQAADAQVAKSARGLARPAKWQTLAMSDEVGALWGEHKGSGSKPYRVAVDLDGPAFKCSCPSRKKPCKHAIALFLTAQANPQTVTVEEVPDWVNEWLQKRQATAERKAQVAEQPVVDEAAQARRAARREDLVQQGIDALRLWLDDLVRQGLSDLPSRPKSFWETQAARLVDAQSPGLARHIREMASVPYSGEGWPVRMLNRLGRLYRLLEAYARLDALSPDVQEEVRTQIGWAQDQATLLAQPGVRDHWLVLSTHETAADRFITRYTWLWGTQTRQSALLLDFIAQSQQARAGGLPVGVALDAELVYFAGPVPQRALLKAQHGAQSMDALPGGYATLDAAFQTTGAALARNPWLERFLWPLLDVIPVPQDDKTWHIQDSAGRTLPLAAPIVDGWRLLGLSGGRPLTLVAEWDRERLTPLSVWTGTELIGLKDED